MVGFRPPLLAFASKRHVPRTFQPRPEPRPPPRPGRGQTSRRAARAVASAPTGPPPSPACYSRGPCYLPNPRTHLHGRQPCRITTPMSSPPASYRLNVTTTRTSKHPCVAGSVPRRFPPARCAAPSQYCSRIYWSAAHFRTALHSTAPARVPAAVTWLANRRTVPLQPVALPDEHLGGTSRSITSLRLIQRSHTPLDTGPDRTMSPTDRAW